MAQMRDQMRGSRALAVSTSFADRPNLRLFALSFLALFLELTIIRWVPGSARLVAYYANLMLISSFLGIGLGAMLAERSRNLVRWFPALFSINVLFLVAGEICAAPRQLGRASVRGTRSWGHELPHAARNFFPECGALCPPRRADRSAVSPPREPPGVCLGSRRESRGHANLRYLRGHAFLTTARIGHGGLALFPCSFHARCGRANDRPSFSRARRLGRDDRMACNVVGVQPSLDPRRL